MVDPELVEQLCRALETCLNEFDQLEEFACPECESGTTVLPEVKAAVHDALDAARDAAEEQRRAELLDA